MSDIAESRENYDLGAENLWWLVTGIVTAKFYWLLKLRNMSLRQELSYVSLDSSFQAFWLVVVASALADEFSNFVMSSNFSRLVRTQEGSKL